MDESRARAERLRRYVDDVLRMRERIASRVPEVSAEDLILILQSVLRPPDLGRRFLLRSPRPGVHVA